MKLNSNSIIRPLSASAVALLLMMGLSNLAMADNAAALKDSIKTVTVVAATDMKETDSSAKASVKATASVDDDFKKLDANKDGKVSLKEAVKDKALASQFDAVDINHDGMLSVDEFISFKTALSTKALESAPAPTVN
jgi:hypothetical protein